MPTCLIECGFHSSREDLQVINNEGGQSAVGFVLAQGIGDYFGWKASYVDDSPDVDDWALDDVEKAVALGLMSRDADGKFKGRQVINRQEVASVAMRLYRKLYS